MSRCHRSPYRRTIAGCSGCLVTLFLLAAFAVSLLQVAGMDDGRPTPPPAPAPTESIAPKTIAVVHGLVGDDNRDGRIDENESGWACWVDGNGMCSVQPLPHRSDLTAPAVAVCGSDSDCAAYDRARGIVSDGRP